MSYIPLIDISPLRADNRAPDEIKTMATALSEACRMHGFFYVVGHGVSTELIERMEAQSIEFFSLSEEEKMNISMKKGGRAWRGYFPLGGELTSGVPDLKEGVYFGNELDCMDWRVKAGMPMHGPNLLPQYPTNFGRTVFEYMEQVAATGHLIMEAIALSLGLEGNYFKARLTADPLILFRIFHYPPQPAGAKLWGVGEHTDYGLLTILLQDNVGGLQVKSRGQWVDAPPVSGTLVCNIGDMLDRMTGGLYRSTPHRVLNVSGKKRLSFPLFFDPSFTSKVERIEGIGTVDDDRDQRWDGASVHDFEGTYGDYLLRKVSGAFPQLGNKLM